MSEMRNSLEQAVENDPALRERFQAAAERLVSEGVNDAAELMRRCAKELGFEPEEGALFEAIDDESLDSVAGGSDLSRDENVQPFRFNTWVGSVLRDLLKRNSAAQSQIGSANGSDLRAVTLPRPETPENSELHCL